MPGSARSAGERGIDVDAGLEREPAAGDGLGERDRRVRARAAVMPQRASEPTPAAASAAAVGKRRDTSAVPPPRVSPMAAPSAATIRPSSVRAPRTDDLLADDRAHRELETVERAGHAQSRTCRGQRPEMRGDVGRVAGEVERVLDAREHQRHDVRQRGRELHGQRRLARRTANGDDPRMRRTAMDDRERARVARRRHRLDAGDRARAKELEHRVPRRTAAGRRARSEARRAAHAGIRSRRRRPGAIR